MKRLFLSVGLCLALLSQAFCTEPPVPVSVEGLKVSSSTGTFTDITSEASSVKLGADLVTDTLRNVFFDKDGMFKSHRDSSVSFRTRNGIEIGFNFPYMEKTMSHFAISAEGAIYLSDSAKVLCGSSFTSTFGSLDSKPWGKTKIADNFITAYPGVVVKQTFTSSIKPSSIFKTHGTAPVTYYLSGEIGSKVLTIQFAYDVDTTFRQSYIYQIQLKETGEISLVVGNMSYSSISPKEYRFVFCAEREDIASLKNYKPALVFNAPAGATNWSNPQGSTNYSSEIFGMPVSNTITPEAGRTLTFSPPSNCTTPTVKNDAIKWKLSSLGESYVNGEISVNNTIYTATDVLPGTLMVLYTTESNPSNIVLEKKYYKEGDVFPISSGSDIECVVIDNKSLVFNDYFGEWTPVQVELQNLTPRTKYYIHTYFSASACLGGPTFAQASSPFELATTIKAATALSIGRSTTTAVNISVDRDNTHGIIIIKSEQAPSVQSNYGSQPLIYKLSGTYAVGDTVVAYTSDNEEYEGGVVAAILDPSEKSTDITFTPGERAFLLAFSSLSTPTSTTKGQNTMEYSSAYIAQEAISVFNNLPISIDLGKEMPAERPTLPVGWSQSEGIPEDASFRIAGLSFGPDAEVAMQSLYAPNFVGEEVAHTPYWVDAISPAFVGVAEEMIVNFNINFFKAGFPSNSVANPMEGDSVKIEYSSNNGEWKNIALFTAKDINIKNSNNQYILSAEFPSIRKEDTIRIRYSYTTLFNERDPRGNYVYSFEVLEKKDCETPYMLNAVKGRIENDKALIAFEDKNLPKAPAYILEYKKVVVKNNTGGGVGPLNTLSEEGSEEWIKVVDTKDSILLSDLSPFTTYSIKATSVCGPEDTSYSTPSILFETFYGLPFTEDFAITPIDQSTAFDRGFKTHFYNQYSNEYSSEGGWDHGYSIDSKLYNDEVAGMAIPGNTALGTLISPTIFIGDAQYHFPKTLKLNLTSFLTEYDDDYNPIIDTAAKPDIDAKLYVLVTNNGTFSFDEKNVLAIYDTADMAKFNDTTIELDVTNYSGSVQIALVYFPDTSYLFNTNEYAADNWALQCNLMKISYDQEPCYPISELKTSGLGKKEITLSWQGNGLEYGILYGLNSSEGYTDTIYTNDASYKLTDLTPSSRYKAAIISYCNEDRTNASAISNEIRFTTLAECAIPTEFAVSEITSTNVKFSSKSTASKRLVYVSSTDALTEFVFEQISDTLKIEDVLSTKTNYVAKTRSVCGANDSSAMSAEISFTTLDALATDSLSVTLTAVPLAGGSVSGAGKYIKDSDVTISATANDRYDFIAWVKGTDTISKSASYTFKITENVSYSAIFKEKTSKENILNAQKNFRVSTKNGTVNISNLNASTIKVVEIYNLTGSRLERFSYNTTDNVSIDMNKVERSILFVRIYSEQGSAVYKVYMN